MADITYQQLSNELAAGSITEVNGTLTINMNNLTGDALITLSDGIAEGIFKILVGASKAQSAYNADPSNTVPINSYPAAVTSGLSTIEGTVGVSYAHTVVSRAVLSTDIMVAV